MERRTQLVSIAILNALLLLLLPASSAAGLPAATEDALKAATYVYISSTRKDGSLGKAAEIWFLYHQGSVYVGSRPSSWRARRIRWGRPRAKIWVGKRDGPSFMADGAIVNDTEVQALMLKTFAAKYPAGWKRHQRSFREGFRDGGRVLIRYTPVDVSPAAATTPGRSDAAATDKETGRREQGKTTR